MRSECERRTTRLERRDSFFNAAQGSDAWLSASQTLKQWTGATHFLTRKLAWGGAEMSLNGLAYNEQQVQVELRLGHCRLETYFRYSTLELPRRQQES